MTIVSLNLQDGSTKERRCSIKKKKVIVPTIVIIIFLLILAIYLLTRTPTLASTLPETLDPPNPIAPKTPSPSPLQKFQKAAVVSDMQVCSEIGRDILAKNGSAVDATIASMFCNGLTTMQSMGLGGGFVMTIYTKHNGQAYNLNARETAPSAAKEDMYTKNPELTKFGGLAIGVPGELKGYIEAHRRFGKLKWEELVRPTIDLCHEGYNISKHQYNALKQKEKRVKEDKLLNQLFIDDNNNIRKEGETVVHKKFCETLEAIEKDPYSFYNGTIRDQLVEDIKELGGVITKEDFNNYEVVWEDAVSLKIKEDDVLYSTALPGSGSILGFILNVLKNYNFTPESVNEENIILTYHRIIETFKFAFAKRTFLGDPNFVNITNLIEALSSDYLSNMTRYLINDNKTFNEPEHYEAFSHNQEDHGTAHISVLAPNGDAVSVTSTINLYFGAAVMSKSTGIVLNSVMDDFSAKGFDNYFGLPYSSANKVEPGKRPLSSMSPSIITDKDGEVILVIGAAGGSKIPTSVALVTMRVLWFGQDLKQAVDGVRFHHQIFPMEVSYEYGLEQRIVDGLEKLEHHTQRTQHAGSVINAILRKNGTVYANADYRKGGRAAGI